MQGRLAGLLLLGAVLPLRAETQHFRCRALDPNSRRPLFTCSGYHVRRQGKPVTAEITYKLPGGKVLAREKINFRKDSEAPDLSLSDERDGRREMIERTPAGFNLLMQETAKTPPELTRLKHTADEAALTIPGLPQYIERQWTKIQSGEKLIFYCAFPAQKKLLRLRVQLVKTLKYKKKDAVLLKLQPDNFVYRWFSEPVFMTVLVADKRLVRYQGLHYLRDPRTGGGSVVDLTFSW